MGVQIYGASFDSPEKNAQFKEVDEFQFELLSDMDHTLAEYYGAVIEGLGFVANRVTVILNPEGIWVAHYPSISSPSGHAQSVLDDMTALLNTAQ